MPFCLSLIDWQTEHKQEHPQIGDSLAMFDFFHTTHAFDKAE